MKFSRSRMHTKCGNLAAAAGDIGEAGGAEAREETADFSSEQIRREVYEHLAVVHFAVGLYPREHFAADGDALLHNPAALRRRHGFLDDCVPISFAGFPAKCDPAAAIFVAGFENE